jgi:hypothetical protein
MLHIALIAIALAFPLLARAEGTNPAEHEPHAGHSTTNAGGTAKVAEPREDMFIALDPSTPKTVKLVIVATYNSANYGMNFNGYAKGGAKYIIPLGWNVAVTFTNNSPVPHSAIVVERSMVKKIQMGEPFFKGASTPNPVRGTTGSKGVEFRFTADEAGEFAVACGFPTHSASGHWIGLAVSESAVVPALQFGDAPPVAAK